MMQFWKALVTVVTTKLTRLLVSLRRFTSPQYVKGWIVQKFRDLVGALLDFRPRHSRDYVILGRWMVSRRLVNAIVILGGVVCLMYLFWLRPIGGEGEGMEVRTYRYSAIPLRLAEGRVRIQAKKGFIAYEGEVSKGYVCGEGILYGEDGQMIYEGTFDRNRYHGTGTLYFDSGRIRYSGGFADNRFEGEGVQYWENGAKRYEGSFSKDLFEGSGIQYRESGVKLYEGGFTQGMKDGEGVLYNASGNVVFSGRFHLDDIVYTQLLGRTAEDIQELYAGEQIVYRNGQADENAVWLREIDALCFAKDNETSLSESLKYDMVCVTKDGFGYGGKVLHTIEELTEAVGAPVYEGNSYLTFPEAVAIDILQKRGKAMGIRTGIDMTPVFDEVNTVGAYQTDAVVYLHAYLIGERTYTFVSEGKTGAFFLYEIE